MVCLIYRKSFITCLYLRRYKHVIITRDNVVWMWKPLTNINDIKKIIIDIQKRRNYWKLSTRRKNLLTLTELGITQSIAFDLIYNHIEWRDYVSGPQLDDHAIPGNIWVFGLTINDHPCYLKFQDRPNGIVMWISFHIADYPLHFPYR